MALELTSKRTFRGSETRPAISGGVKVEITWQFPTTESSAAPSQTQIVRPAHAFAAISGLLENHPLRDEYLEALGITE